MYTKKQVVLTSTRIASIIGIGLGFMRENWIEALAFIFISIIFIMLLPWLVTLIVLKKDEQEEVDGELYLWNNDDRIDYRLSLNAVNEIPYKEYLKIRVNENARDESIMKKK